MDSRQEQEASRPLGTANKVAAEPMGRETRGFWRKDLLNPPD